jgi:hypothetical protein
MFAVAFFGSSDLLFYRLTFPTTRHHSIVRASGPACRTKCFETVLLTSPGDFVSALWGSLLSCAPVVYRRSRYWKVRVYNPQQAVSLPHIRYRTDYGCVDGGTMPLSRMYTDK